jgi:transposase
MPAYIRTVKSKSGATSIQIEYKRGRKRTGILHIGTAHNEAEIRLLRALAYAKIHEGQLSLDLDGTERSETDARLRSSYSALLWGALEHAYRILGFDNAVDDPVFRQLVLARIVEPSSKLDTIRIIGDLGIDAPANTAIHRSLKRTVKKDFRSAVSRACFNQAIPSELMLVLYDVTTLYFEIQKDDEYRKPGLSKERRLEPQITVGLLVDRCGFPLEIQSFEGNKAEVHTIIPVLSDFKKRHGLKDITVTADAAMLSAGNIEELERLGFHYIIGSKLSKTPYEIEARLSGEEIFGDGEIFESKKTVTIDGRRVKRREIFQYRSKRAALDLSNIGKTVAKAQKIVENKGDIKRNRFLKIIGDIREVNLPLVEEAKKRAGIKGYLTDLDIPAQQVIDAYHQLFQVERSFRMSKSDLKARPVFHHIRDSIEAHLTIVFTALAVARYIESCTEISIKKFVQTIEPVRTGIVSVGNDTFELQPEIPPEVALLIRKLSSV